MHQHESRLVQRAMSASAPPPREIGIPYLDQPPARSHGTSRGVARRVLSGAFSGLKMKDLNWHRENFNVHSLRFQPAVEPSS